MNAATINDAPPAPHQPHRRLIGRHFAGRISPGAESEMRAHLADCGTCRAVYDRHLLLSRLDPISLPAEQRLARGLGFAPRARAGLLALLTLTLAPVAAGIIIVVSFHAPRGDQAARSDVAGPAPRGAATTAAPAFWAYRIDRAGPPKLAEPSILPRDELAFAYANPGGLRYLMIFGRDEHRHVYWFYPAWPAGQPAPAAIRAEVGPGPHELADAIGHAYDGRRLDLFAVFGSEPTGVTAIEEISQDAGDAADLASRLAARALLVQHRTLEVKR